MRFLPGILALALISGSITAASYLERERTLEPQYQAINARYFDGRLPAATVVYSDTVTPNALATTVKDGPNHFLIEVRPGTDLSVLEHESCQVFTALENEEHGPEFERCMQRFGK